MMSKDLPISSLIRCCSDTLEKEKSSAESRMKLSERLDKKMAYFKMQIRLFKGER